MDSLTITKYNHYINQLTRILVKLLEHIDLTIFNTSLPVSRLSNFHFSISSEKKGYVKTEFTRDFHIGESR